MQKLLISVLLLLTAACTHPEMPQTPTATPDLPHAATPTDDSLVWLEDVEGKKALEFVNAANHKSLGELQGRPEYQPLYTRLLTMLDSKDRIPYVSERAGLLYNFWKDDKHIRGIWRRTTWAEYRKPQPQWETVLDLDQLAKDENENWVWASAACLFPDYDHCLLRMSRGGGDAAVVREFNVKTRQFVADGFNLPAAKSEVDWIDADHVYVSSDFGPGSMTQSGYPRIVKEWQRGTPLSAAKTLFTAQETDVGVGAGRNFRPGSERDFVTRLMTFYTNELFLRAGDKLVKIDKPDDANADVDGHFIFLSLRTPWTVGGKTYAAGALLAADFVSYMKGEREFQVLFEPTPQTSLAQWTATQHNLLMVVLDNVKSRVFELTPVNGKWQKREVKLPGVGSASALVVNPYTTDQFFLTFTDFLTPTTEFLAKPGSDKHETLKHLPAFFDAKGLNVQQFHATSKDGTQVPYFVVARDNLALNGSHPTLLYGYGGFEVSLQPGYSAGSGLGWLEKGGVYVQANIRGGGEFGPQWHQAAVKENRQRAYDDFAAVAEDLIARKITSPQHLAIQGGSNGGLLVGAVAVQRPELFKAVICQVPLLDMRRYHRLLAGASWMGEYGDPDKPEQWAYISRYSPYQNVKKDVRYPRIFFLTSTRDDRVHPGHARKMYAKMQEQGHDVLYFENTEGGHGGAANNPQLAKMSALVYSFLWQELK
jgi:prolyl oligopeptidase